MYIKRGNTNIVEVKKATYTGNLMGERSVTCEISSPTPITFKLNDYVELKLCNTIATSTVEYTEKFYIFSDASIKRNSGSGTAGNAYEYTVKLYPAQYELQNMIEMRNVGDTDEGFYTFMSEYYLYGTVKDLCTGIIAVINQYKSLTGTNRGIKKEISEVIEAADATTLASLTGATDKLYITKDNGKFYHYDGSSFVDCTEKWNIFIWNNSITTDSYQYSFNSTYVWNALAMVNNEEELDLDFVVIGRTILIGFHARTIRGTDDDYVFQYQSGALFNLSKQINEGTGIVNRLRAYGSTKNVARYYNSTGRNTGRYIPRLMLPSFSEDNEKDYVENEASQTAYGLREGSKNFDDIYPTIQNVLLSQITISSSTVQIYTIKTLASANVVWVYGGVVSYDSNGNQVFTHCAPASKLKVTIHDYTASKDFTFDWNISDTFTRGSATYYGKIVQTSDDPDDNLASSHSFSISEVIIETATERKKKDSTYQYCPYAYNANNPSQSSDELNEILAANLIKNEDGEVTSFEIFIRDLGFDLEECFFSGGEYVWMNSGTPKFNMLDGLLGGLDFDLADSGFERITANGDYATQYALGARFKATLCINTQNEYSNLPNDTLKCYAGDHFSIYNIDMPVLYVTWAEERLKEEADKYLADVCIPEYQYSMELDKITTIVNASLAKQLIEGSVMKIHDTDVVGSTDIELPIQTMTIEFNGSDKGYNVGTGDADSISNASKSTVSASAKRQASTFGNVVSTVVKTEEQVNKLKQQSTSYIPSISEHLIFGHTFNGTQDVKGNVEIVNDSDNTKKRILSTDSSGVLELDGAMRVLGITYFGSASNYINNSGEGKLTKLYLGSGAYVEYDSVNDAFHFNKAIYSDNEITAGGAGSGGGGTSGTLYALNDVYHDGTDILRADGTTKQAGDILSYSSALSKWVALEQSAFVTDSNKASKVVSSFFGKTGAITCVQNSTTNGAVNFDMSAGGQLSATVYGGYNAGNCNNSSTPWAASTLATSGRFTSGGDIVPSGTCALGLSGSAWDRIYANTIYEGSTALASKYSPLSHASSATTYGIGTSSNYGHVKLGASDQNGATATDGICAPNGHTHSQYLSQTDWASYIGTGSAPVKYANYINAQYGYGSPADGVSAEDMFGSTDVTGKATVAFMKRGGKWGGNADILFWSGHYKNGATQLAAEYTYSNSNVRPRVSIRTFNTPISDWTPWCEFWTDNNAGSTAYDWAAKNLTLAGTLSGVTSIDSLLSFDITDGEVTVSGALLPDTDSTRNIGSNLTRFANIYADVLHVSAGDSYGIDFGGADGYIGLDSNNYMQFCFASGYIFDNELKVWDGNLNYYDIYCESLHQQSDERKKNIQAERYLNLSEINSLRSVKFNFLGKTEDKAGTIAQDVLKVLPEVVTEDSKGFYSLDYGALATVLALSLGKVSQSQEERIAALEAQIEDLQNELATLKVN